MTSPPIRTSAQPAPATGQNVTCGEQDEQGDGGEAEPDDRPGPLAALREGAGGDRLGLALGRDDERRRRCRRGSRRRRAP